MQIIEGKLTFHFDAHPKVVSKDKLQNLPWMVE